MGLVITAWPSKAEKQHEVVRDSLETLKSVAHVLHVKGFTGEDGSQVNPYFIDVLGPEIIPGCVQIKKALRSTLNLRKDDAEGRPPYWVTAIRAMLESLDVLIDQYNQLMAAHNLGKNLVAQRRSEIGQEGIEYITEIFYSIPAPLTRYATKIRPPSPSLDWEKELEYLDISGLPDVSQ